MTDDGLLDRAELERAFAALGDRLAGRGVEADLFLVGFIVSEEVERIVTEDAEAA